MKYQTLVLKTHEITHLVAIMGVRYWEDATVNGEEDTNGDLIPCRNGDNWEITVDAKTGRIKDWPEGTEAKIHYKVCDGGEYSLYYGPELVASLSEYVPETFCPGGDGYGERVIMTIEKDGTIQGWSPDPMDWDEEE